MGLGRACRLGEILNSSYGWQATRGGTIFVGGVDPSRHNVNHGYLHSAVSEALYNFNKRKRAQVARDNQFLFQNIQNNEIFEIFKMFKTNS